MTPRRLSFSFCSAFLTTLFLLHWWPEAPFSIGIWATILIIVMAVIGLRTMQQQKTIRILLVTILCAVAIALLSLAHATHRTTPQTADFYTSNVTMEGSISGEPDRREKVTNYTVDADTMRRTATGTTFTVKGTILVTDFRRFPAFDYGDRIVVHGTLEKPEDNKGSSVIAPYLRSQGFVAVMAASGIQKLSSGNGSSVIAALVRIKTWFESRLNTLLPEPESSLAAGLLTGSRRGLPRNLTDDFRTVGLTHIVAISGTNITIILTLVMSMLFWLPLRLRILPASIGIILFTLFVGASASVVRAAIMGILGLIAISIGRQTEARLTILWTAVAMLIWNPLQLWGDAGFALSFASVTGLCELSPIIKPYLERVPESFSIRESLTATIAAQFAAVPISLLLFGNLSLIAPLANILVAPAIPLAMLFGALCVAMSVLWLPLGFLTAMPAWAFLRFIVAIAENLAQVPGAALQYESVNPWIVAVYYAALVVGVASFNNKQHTTVERASGPFVPSNSNIPCKTLPS
ncbi:MAG: ComEC/Rec2 family competence protein [Candidatus Peregrinibacteria bacterium]